MPYIPDDLKSAVVARANNRCEYCKLSQTGQEATFHIDHVTPVVAGGETILQNLALACVSCSLRKGSRELVVDPVTGEQTELFNPRMQNWYGHFRWDSVYLVGLTKTGRATIEALAMNRVLILAIRQEETLLGRHPQENQDKSF